MVSADADIMRLVTLAGWNVEQAEDILAGDLAPPSLKGFGERDQERIFQNALCLLLGRLCPEFFGETNALALRFAMGGLGPQLIAVTRQPFDVSSLDMHRPEPTVAGHVHEVVLAVRRADDDELARHLGRDPVDASRPRSWVRERKALRWSTSLFLMPLSSAASAIQRPLIASITSLPSPAERHLVGEPLLLDGERVEHLGLADALGAFEDEHLVELDAGSTHATDGGKQDDPADGSDVLGVGGAAVSDEPVINRLARPMPDRRDTRGPDGGCSGTRGRR